MGTFKDNLGNEYMDPYIPQKIVGFIGIDPDIVGGSGSGGGSGIDDHEQLRNLLGGDASGHYHINASQYKLLYALFHQGIVPHGVSDFYMLDDYYRDDLIDLISTLGMKTSRSDTSAKSAQTALDDYIDARIAAYMASQSSSG